MSGGDGTKTLTSELDSTASHTSRPEILIVTKRHAPACDAFEPKPGQRVTLGRSRACVLPIDDDELSSEHLSIEHLEGHRWAITDHGSKNGTYLNGARLEAGRVEHAGEHLFVRAGGTVIVLGHSPRREGASSASHPRSPMASSEAPPSPRVITSSRTTPSPASAS